MQRAQTRAELLRCSDSVVRGCHRGATAWTGVSQPEKLQGRERPSGHSLEGGEDRATTVDSEGSPEQKPQLCNPGLRFLPKSVAAGDSLPPDQMGLRRKLGVDVCSTCHEHVKRTPELSRRTRLSEHLSKLVSAVDIHQLCGSARHTGGPSCPDELKAAVWAFDSRTVVP